MYKSTSRNQQRWRDAGKVKRGATAPTGSVKVRSKGGRKKTKLTAKIDRGVEARREREWMQYLDYCQSIGRTPQDVPRAILLKWRSLQSE